MTILTSSMGPRQVAYLSAIPLATEDDDFAYEIELARLANGGCCIEQIALFLDFTIGQVRNHLARRNLPCIHGIGLTTIYGLYAPPSNTIRYIGQTKWPRRRLLNHRLNVHSRPRLKGWLSLLKENDVLVQMKILDQRITADPDALEMKFIREYLESGHDLLNVKL